MIKCNTAYADTAHDRDMAPGEFELQTPFWAFSQLDGRHALELHYRATEVRRREEVTDTRLLHTWTSIKENGWTENSLRYECQRLLGRCQ